MAGIKISGLPAVVTPALTDTLPVVQGGVTKKETLTQVQSLMGTVDITMSNGTAIKPTNGLLDTFNFMAYDVDGGAYSTFMSLRSNNTPRLLIASPAGGQVLFDSFGGTFTINSATIGNTTPAAATFTGITLSTGGAIKTGTGIGDQYALQAWDTNDNIFRSFITLSAGNTPACAIGAPSGGSLTIDGAVLGGNSPISILQASSITSNALIGVDSISVNFGHPMQFYNGAGTFYTGLQAGSAVANRVFTLPADFPASTLPMVSTAGGVMSFVDSLTMTSLTAGNLTMIGDAVVGTGSIVTIATSLSGSPINLSPNGGFVSITDFGNAAAQALRFYNAAGTHYVGFKTTDALATDTTWTWMTANVANGLLTTDGSNNMSFTLTPTGLTSLNAGNITLTGNSIAASNGLNLSISGAPGTGGVLTLINGNDVGRIRLGNNIGNHYVGLRAGSLSADVEFVLPSTDGSAGQALTTDGSANLSFASAPFYTPTYVSGCGITYASATTLTIASGSAIDSTGVTLITSAGYTLNFATTGANALDAGSVASNSLYYIFLIRKNDGTTDSLASLSSSSPTLPSGYTTFRRIGTWQTITGTNLALFVQRGNKNKRYYELIGTRAAAGSGGFIFLSGGNATTTTTIDISAYIPSSTTYINLQLTLSVTAVAHSLQVKNSNSSNYVQLFVPGVTANNISQCRPLTLSTLQKFDYVVSNAADSATIELIAYEEEI